MTVVQLRAAVPSQDGRTQADGEFHWRPTARYIDGDTVVLPAPFTVSLVDGAEVDVAPSEPSWVWQVTESVFGAKDRTRFLIVPISIDPVLYKDLVEVDPLTLEPSAAPDPLWYGLVNTLSASAEQASEAAVEARAVVVAETGNASSYAAAALASKNAAAGSATSAGTSATSAASAQASAAGFASSASGSAAAAADSAMAAAGSATSASGSAATATTKAAESTASANGFSMGVVTTLPSSQSAEATISGVAPDRKLNLGIPRGPALEVSVIGTQTGPAVPGTPGLKGDKGDKGDPGGFSTATDLGTQDLNTILTAGLYRVTQGANVTTALNYPVTLNATAVMSVMMVSATNVIQQFEFILSLPAAAGFWQRSTSNGGTTWGAWKFFASSRMDQTAGRALYTFDSINYRDQLIYGDTGSREISAYLDTSKWVAGNIKIRRVNYDVELRAYGLDNVAGILGSVGILNAGLPAGFRNQHTVAGFAQIGANSGQVITAFGATQVTIVGVLDSVICGFTARWQTTDPWPTVLPGNADGAIPNL